MTPYLEEGIKNQATLEFNGTPITSNEVTVNPPEDPPVDKEVTNASGEADTAAKNQLSLVAMDDVFYFNVNTRIPSNVEGFTSVVLEDTLEDVLSVQSSDIQILVDTSEQDD